MRLKVAPQPTKVTMAMGRTINIGNYESLRIEITVESTLGTYTPTETLDKLEKVIKNDIDKRIKRNVAELRG